MTLRTIIAGALALGLSASATLGQTGQGSSPLTGVKGGTNNAFMQFSGPASSLKTYTLPNVSGTLSMLSQIETWTGAQSFTDGTLILLGSGSGSSTLHAPASGGGALTLPAGADTLVGRASIDTLTNKTLTAPAINGGALGAITGLGIRSTGAAFDVRFAATEVLTADRTLTWVLGDASRSITLAGNVALGGAFTMSGAFGFTGVLTGTTSVTFPTAGTLATLAGAETLTNKTFVCANQTSCVIRLGSDVTGQTPIANGGTGQSTAVAARQASGLNVYGDAGTAHGDAGVTLGNTERFAYTNAAFTASRAWVLPAANVTGAPYTLKIADLAGGVTATNTLVITRAGADTINGGTTATMSAANGGYECSSDGSSKWSCLAMGAASAGGVSSVSCGTGLSGGTITTSGTCALALTNATLQASPANPTGTASATSVMMGLGATCKITPVYSGRVWLKFTGQVGGNASANDSYQAKYGTGTAPANAAALTGTSIGSGIIQVSASTNFTLLDAGGIITGLIVGTAVWFDLSLASGSGTASLQNITCSAMEF